MDLIFTVHIRSIDIFVQYNPRNQKRDAQINLYFVPPRPNVYLFPFYSFLQLKIIVMLQFKTPQTKLILSQIPTNPKSGYYVREMIIQIVLSLWIVGIFSWSYKIFKPLNPLTAKMSSLTEL